MLRTLSPDSRGCCTSSADERTRQGDVHAVPACPARVRAPGPAPGRPGVAAATLALSALAGCSSPGPLAVTPNAGSRTGGQAVELRGAHFDDEGEEVALTGHGPVAIYFGERAAVGVVIEGDTLIRAVTPKRELAGSVDVRLWFDDGLRLTLADGYEYQDTTGIVLTPGKR